MDSVLSLEEKVKHLISKKRKVFMTTQTNTRSLNHISATQGQVNKLEKVFNSIDTKAMANKREAMASLIKEDQEIIAELAETVALLGQKLNKEKAVDENYPRLQLLG